MAANVSGGSATIYQFPPRGRFASAPQNESAAAISLASLRAPKISFGGGWYHDEAIEAERALQN